MNNQVGPYRPRNSYRVGADPRIIDANYEEVQEDNSVWYRVNFAYIMLWAYILGKFALVGIMWLFNIVGLKGINLFLGLAELLIFAFLAFAPKNLIGSGVIGGIVAALMDRDKTQGIATGPYWLYRIVLVVGFGSMFAAFYLSTWSFQASPESFWAIFGAVLILLMAEQVTRKSSVWGMRFITAYALFTIALASWQTFGIDVTVPDSEVLGSATSAIYPQFADSVIDWWPLYVIGICIVAMAFAKLRPLAFTIICATLVAWAILGIFGGEKGPCAVQNNKPVPEKGGLNVTLCSRVLAEKNSMSIPRIGPLPVEIEFANSTIERYGDVLKGLNAEDFAIVEETGMTDAEFHFYLHPNNDQFYKHGLHNEPLNFVIKYKRSEILPAD